MISVGQTNVLKVVTELVHEKKAGKLGKQYVEAEMSLIIEECKEGICKVCAVECL